MPSQADMSAVRARLAFTCSHEVDHLPPLDPVADQIFKYGRHLEKQDGPKNFDEIARYYRIAAAYGHYKANNNLQGILTDGLASSPDAAREAVDLADQLIKAGVPSGYYDMGHYLELGYGVEQDADKARRYFRKAADQGSPEAQAYVGELLAPLDRAPDIARRMRQCATDQGYGDAASTLAIDLQTDKLYAEATAAFQKGVAAGDTLSASALEGAFAGPLPGDLHYLALPSDSERARRYRVILEFIRANDGRNPKVPDIDKIVPLPPATLPPWDGTFQWLKEQNAAVPPQKPSDELIEGLSKAKNLDPATGLPLDSSSKTSQVERLPLGTVAKTGERCPQNGIWCAKRWARRTSEATQSFGKGDVMPALVISDPRLLPVLDALLGKRTRKLEVQWELISYSPQV